MDESIITYEKLYDILRKEKSFQELQKLESNFFNDVIKYLKEKTEILESQKKKRSIFSSAEVSRTRKELESIEKILKELYERRENKIIQMALNSTKGLYREEEILFLDEEKVLYTELQELLGSYRKGILNRLLQKQYPSINKKSPKELKKDQEVEKTKVIRFLHAIPKFVGDDLYVYGPYEKEDIAHLPSKVADVLINKNRAMEIKINI